MTDSPDSDREPAARRPPSASVAARRTSRHRPGHNRDQVPTGAAGARVSLRLSRAACGSPMVDESESAWITRVSDSLPPDSESGRDGDAQVDRFLVTGMQPEPASHVN